MPNVIKGWVDQPLVTEEERVERTSYVFPWQSPVKGINKVSRQFYAYGEMDHGTVFRVLIPEGFITDFYSIPVFVRPLIPRSLTGWNQAAVVHDQLYINNCVELYVPYSDVWMSGEHVSRYTADSLFYALMEEFQASSYRKHIIYTGVRVGGVKAWTKYREGAKQCQHSGQPL